MWGAIYLLQHNMRKIQDKFFMNQSHDFILTSDSDLSIPCPCNPPSLHPCICRDLSLLSPSCLSAFSLLHYRGADISPTPETWIFTLICLVPFFWMLEMTTWYCVCHCVTAAFHNYRTVISLCNLKCSLRINDITFTFLLTKLNCFLHIVTYL